MSRLLTHAAPLWARHVATTFAALALGTACTPPPRTEVPLRVVDDLERGATLTCPPDWLDESIGAARVFSGPEGADTYYATVTLRRFWAPGSLDAALLSLYGPATHWRGFSIDWQEPAVIANRPALVYRLRFELHETERTKVGAVIAAGHDFVDLSYGVVSSAYGPGLDVFADMLVSLDLI